MYPAPSADYADQTGVGFAVDNLEDARARVEAAGWRPAAIKDNPWGRSFVVRDPDGRRVEIVANIPPPDGSPIESAA